MSIRFDTSAAPARPAAPSTPQPAAPAAANDDAPRAGDDAFDSAPARPAQAAAAPARPAAALPSRSLGFDALTPPVDRDGPVDPSLPDRPVGRQHGGEMMHYQWWVTDGLARGDQPKPEEFSKLASEGFKSVINLRGEDNSEAEPAAAAGLNTYHLDWTDGFPPTTDQIKGMLDFMTAPENQPAMVHCFAGVNRTSVAVAAYRMAVEGWPLEKAMQEGLTYGMHTPSQLDFLRQFSSDLSAGKVPGYPLQQPPPLHSTLPDAPGAGVKLWEMPEAGEQPFVDALHNAGQSIDLSCYLMTDPAVVQALKDAAGRGVAVRVMLEPDPVGDGKSNFEQMKTQLEAAGVQVETTPPRFDSDHNVDHAKFMVIDGKETLIGTGNLVKSSLGGTRTGHDRDFWLDDTRAQTASEAEQLFNADWNRTSTDGIDFQNLVVTPDNGEEKIVDFIDNAKQSLYVYNQELTDSTILEHLLAAKQRGVDVHVLAAHPESGTDRNAYAIKKLQAAGIPAHEMTTDYLHAKAMVADGRAFVGSQNFSYSALLKNRELGEIIDDAGAVEQLRQRFLADEAANTPAAP
ncbi:MAG TPA: phospholipase D-like domain-containing protein [Myxococcales bacterium]|nr:phospholipase D-like domain-containing protein [Myxococcales bacterium]